MILSFNKEELQKMKIKVFYEKTDDNSTYCPNCLRQGYPSDFVNFDKRGGFKSDLAYGRCKQCGYPIDLRLGRKIKKIQLEYVGCNFILVNYKNSDVSYILKQYSDGFKRWYKNQIHPSAYGIFEEIENNENLLIYTVFSNVEQAYNISGLPLCYFDELKDYELEIIKVESEN